MMNMCCVQTLSQSLRLITEDSVCLTLFPKVELLLETPHENYMKAIKYVAHRKNQKRYRSVMDFICMEVFPDLQAGCWKYYDDNGPPLRELISPEEIERREEMLVCFVLIAHSYMCEDRATDWTKTRSAALNFYAK